MHLCPRNLRPVHPRVLTHRTTHPAHPVPQTWTLRHGYPQTPTAAPREARDRNYKIKNSARQVRELFNSLRRSRRSTSISFVPPSYGEPSTRNRNLRRRQKCVAEHNQPPDEPLAPTSGANAVLPLPIQQNSLTRTSSEAYVADAEPEPEPEPNVMVVSLRNKNKKKNFHQLMDKPLPPKVVFAELENAPAQADPPDKLAVPLVKHARLIPPSERDGLPSNIFVTSVDVEEGQQSKKKRRSKEELVTASCDNESRTAHFTLDYGLAEVLMTNPGEALHLRVEQQWDLLPKLTSASHVKVDNVIAYKRYTRLMSSSIIYCLPCHVTSADQLYQ
ncbi:hypothetical protein EV702DRAFT_1225264 [Suillus placidus]|uniref:Uncharacterized protein n=1 Tax=Suillus placidus TaxID=48579 RepID=A0A9P6ZF38_9AGAM|nr:hypothetical protein EV702DRAFT_1225264 [Suillus placidus]